MKLKLIYLICAILCVFLTFSTVNAADLDTNLAAIDSQSESSFTNLNDDVNIETSIEDEDCVGSMNELSNLNDDLNNQNKIKSSLSSIDSDENSLKSTLNPSGNTFSSIQDSINSAKSGDTISLNGRTYYGNGTLIYVNKSVTISGGQGDIKATLDAKNLSRILRVTAANVKLINCNFINSNERAVIFSNDNGMISNCDFKDNFANENSHLCVYANCTNFLMENSNFYNGLTNVAIKAVNSTVINCTFVNNTVENDYSGPITGAALQIGDSAESICKGSVIGCVFINNKAISKAVGNHGGALCFRPGIKVFNSTFISNYCSGVGGVTTLHSDGELYDCIFINNSAGVYGGAISTGFSLNNISVNISSCIFENNTAPMGGAIQVKGNNVKIVNSTFNGNNADDTDGGALYIMGNDALIINSSFDKNYARNIGAGVLINGTDVSILNSSFNGNIAGFGAAIYVVGSDANIFSSNFTNHSVTNGSVYIKGPNTYVYDSDFNNNQGENGAAIYIDGSNSNLILNNFTFNDAVKKGGAVYIEGSNANIISSNFLNNSAIPDISDIGSGLGGAIYIKGDNNTIDSSNFTFNTARNGSAIYTDGIKMTLSNTDFDKNQAWSYVLDSDVDPSLSHFNESDIFINFTLIGGNNIANAIYNTASTKDIYFYNVSYVSSKGPKFTGEDEIHPVNGAQNSNDGSLLYQDDPEDNQLVNVLIFKNPQGTDGNKLASSSYDDYGDISDNLLVNNTFVTGILGDIQFNMSDFTSLPLETGNYIVLAKHFEDDYYKEIDENNEFDIIPIVDLAINISSSRVNIDFNKTVKYTIKIDNYGPNNATGTKVNALANGFSLLSRTIIDATGTKVNVLIPEGLIYLNSSASIGTYDEKTGIWTIGGMDVGDNQTLVINVLTNKTGIIDFPVNITSNEDDSNEKNNFNNKTIRVLMADLSIDVKASEDQLNYGDLVDWTITVKNNGPNDASKLVVSILPFEGDLIYLNSSRDSYNDSSFIWKIPDLAVDDEIALVISTKVNSSNKEIELLSNVSSETYDPDMSNNLDSDSVNVFPLCDLIIKVNMSSDSVDSGDNIDLMILVSNDCPDDASDVSVSLSDLESLGLVVLDGVDDSFDKDSYEWSIGDLNQGESVSLTIPLQVECSNDTVLVEGTVDTSTFELNKENNHDSDELSINPLCDLIIDISFSNSTIRNGDNVDLLVVVSNDGPDDASDVSVSLSDLESLGLMVLNSSDDSYNQKDNEWIIGDLANGDSVSLSISTRANKSGENITVLSEVGTSTFELNKENNLDNDSLNILPVCDVEITITPDNSLVNAGDTVNWIINVTNNGPDNASDVNVFNSLPEGLEFIYSQSNKGEVENITDEEGNVIDFIWKVGDLDKNESAFLVISTNALDEGLIPNNASVNTSTFDLNESNNFDSTILEVVIKNDTDETDDDPNEEEPNDDEDNYEGDDDPDEDYSNDEIPDFDYLLDDNGDDSNKSVKKVPKLNKSNKIMNKKSKKPIDISNNKTGNPLAFAVLSIFAIFLLPVRKF